MNLNDVDKRNLQEATIPPGYYLVESGSVQPGDIRWNVWHDCWNFDAPLESPRHDCVIGDPITNFHGILRKI